MEVIKSTGSSGEVIPCMTWLAYPDIWYWAPVELLVHNFHYLKSNLFDVPYRPV